MIGYIFYKTVFIGVLNKFWDLNHLLQSDVGVEASKIYMYTSQAAQGVCVCFIHGDALLQQRWVKKKEPIVESSGTEPDDAHHLWEMLVNTGTELIYVIPEDKI